MLDIFYLCVTSVFIKSFHFVVNIILGQNCSNRKALHHLPNYIHTSDNLINDLHFVLATFQHFSNQINDAINCLTKRLCVIHKIMTVKVRKKI